MAVHVPLTQAEKDWIIRRKGEGLTLPQIAHDLDCSFFTVRKWWRAQHKPQPRRPRGRPPAGILSRFPAAVREHALALKRTHPHWGPIPVRFELASRLGVAVNALP